jgi:hypothetical protein
MKFVELLTKMMEARDVVHVAHLRTTSYAAHKALGGLYGELLVHFDSLAELYQGQFGLVDFKDFSVKVVKPDDIVEYLEDFCGDVIDTKKQYTSDMAEMGHLVNELEAVTTTIYSSLYKLKFLK